MKRKILCILLVCCLLLLAGCHRQEPPQVNTIATEPSTTATVETTEGTTETTAAATKPEETKATEATTAPTEPQATEPTTAPTQPTDPTEPSKPEPTNPAPTEPPPTEPTPTETVPPEPPTEETVPPTTEPEQTQPAEEEIIDIAVLEAYGRSYASSAYGYNGTSACSPGSGAGYFPGATKEILTMADGYSLVRQAIDSQYYRDIACGYSPYEEIDGVTVRCPINIRIEATGQPNVYVIWVYYGGSA